MIDSVKRYTLTDCAMFAGGPTIFDFLCECGCEQSHIRDADITDGKTIIEFAWTCELCGLTHWITSGPMCTEDHDCVGNHDV